MLVVQSLRLVKEAPEESSPAAPSAAASDRRATPAPTGAEDNVDDVSPAADEPPGHRRARLAHILSPGLRPTFLLLLALSVFAMNLNVLLPVIAAEVLGGGSGTYSVLHTCLRAGALVGSLFAAMAATRTADQRRIFVALVLCGAALMSMAAGTQAIVTAVTIVVTGACVGLFLSMASASVQTGADRAIQGRQVAVYSFISSGAARSARL